MTPRANSTVCPDCGGDYKGLLECHCTGCHETFSRVSVFDAHRSRERCKSPARVGMVKDDSVWKFPPWDVNPFG